MVLIHSNYARNIVFENQKESYSLIFGKGDYLEKSLFEFSNKMGAFILSLMIYWMNPKNYTI